MTMYIYASSDHVLLLHVRWCWFVVDLHTCVKNQLFQRLILISSSLYLYLSVILCWNRCTDMFCNCVIFIIVNTRKSHTHSEYKKKSHTHACTHARTCTHTHARMHTCTRTHARTHTHTHTHTKKLKKKKKKKKTGKKFQFFSHVCRI